MESKSEEAIEQYKEAIAVYPKYSPAYYNLGVAYSEARQVGSLLMHL